MVIFSDCACDQLLASPYLWPSTSRQLRAAVLKEERHRFPGSEVSTSVDDRSTHCFGHIHHHREPFALLLPRANVQESRFRHDRPKREFLFLFGRIE